MVHVIIIDDHAIVREGLKQVIGETDDIHVSGEAGGGHEGLTIALESQCDVLLMDLSMPNGSGLDTLAQLRSVMPELPVLILSMHPEEQFAVRVLNAGAAGYLSKDAAPDELIGAIRCVASGHKYVSPSVMQRIVNRVGAPSCGLPHEALSDREFQVLRLLASGRRVGEIADRLTLSVKTVSTYRARLLEKMHMKSNADLMRYALEHGLVE